ncbi:hypothetical protein BG004_004746 [Podila humilis]|nr:hypothetical protein BG004_004746 [Podila humilis]
MLIDVGLPGCIAANNHTIYYIAKTFMDGQRAVALVKSPRLPSSFSATNTTTDWTIVSVSPSQNLISSKLWDFFNNSDCSVDNNGVFSWRSYHDQFAKSVRYDPIAPWTSTAGPSIINTGSQTNGAWSAVSLVQPENMYGLLTLMSHTPDPAAVKDTLVVYYPHSADQNPTKHIPTIHYANVKMDKFQIQVNEKDIVQVQVTGHYGAVYNLAFGDNQMFTILRGSATASTTQSDGSNNVRYNNKTLAYFPFESPYTLLSPPESIVNVPWDPACADYEYDDLSAAAVAKEKLYYICEPLDALARATYTHLYIFDSVAKVSKGPFRLEVIFRSVRHFTLAYGSALEKDPQFLFLNHARGIHVVDLATAINNDSGATALTMIDITGSVTPPKTDLQPPAPEAPASNTSSTATIIIVATVVPILIIIATVAGFLLWRRKRRRQILQQHNGVGPQTLAVDREGAPHELSGLSVAEPVVDLPPPYVEDEQT